MKAKILAASMLMVVASAASADPIDFNYNTALQWTGPQTWTDGDTSQAPYDTGRHNVTQGVISWGASWGSDGVISPYNTPSSERSGLYIDPVLATGTIVTDGAATNVNAFDHVNNIISAAFSTLESTQLQLDIQLWSPDGTAIRTWTKTFQVYFSETPNNTGNNYLDADVFAITWDGSYSESFVYGDYEYTFNYFAPADAFTPLSQSACAAVNQTNCVGFITPEDQVTSIQFQFGVTAVAVPEPETAVMLLAGLGILGMVARRRNRRV